MLRVGRSDDPLEREADRVADQLLQQPANQHGIAASTNNGTVLQTESAENNPAQMTNTHLNSDAQSVINSAGAGMPLTNHIRSGFQTRFGRDFSNVRIHTDSAANRSADEFSARAYTLGTHIVFGQSEYSPESSSGRRLLAHELTHVVQQDGAAAPAIQREEKPFRWSAVPREKTSLQVENAYRRTRNQQAADAVKGCREYGLCNHLLTSQEAWQAYKTGRIKANLGAPPERGPGAAGGGVAAAGLAAPVLSQTARSVGTTAVTRTATHLTLLQGGLAAEASAGTAAAATAVEAGAGTAAATGTGAAVSTVAVPLAVGAVLVLAVIDLMGYASFQAALEAQGYVVLPDALGACIGACHQPALPRTHEPFPFSDFGPTSPDMLKEFLKPTVPKPDPNKKTTPSPLPAPQPDPKKKDRKKKCRQDPCPYPLPINWPRELPLPVGAALVRTPQLVRDEEALGGRGPAQETLRRRIVDAASSAFASTRSM